MATIIKIINGIRNYSNPNNPESKCTECGVQMNNSIPPYDIPCQNCYEEACVAWGYKR